MRGGQPGRGHPPLAQPGLESRHGLGQPGDGALPGAVDGGEVQHIVEQRQQLGLGQRHREHHARLRRLHEPTACRDQAHRVGQREHPGQAGGHQLTHTVPEQPRRSYAPVRPELRQRVLDDEQRRLRVPGLLELFRSGLPLVVGGEQQVPDVRVEQRRQEVRGPVHLGAEHRLSDVEGVRHAGALRALTGEGEQHRAVGGGLGRPGRRSPQRLDHLGGAAADDRPAVRQGPPAALQGVRHLGQRRVRVGAQVRGESVGSRVEGGGCGGGQGQQVPPAALLARRAGRGLLHDDVRVGAADAERADPGTAHPGGPWGAGRDDVEGTRVQSQLGVGGAEVQRRWDLPGPQCQHRLDQTDDPGGGVEVPDVRLDRAEPDAARRQVTEGTRQRGHLDRVTERGAGAVRLDVTDRAGVDPGDGERLGDDVGLPVHARGGEADLAVAVVVHGRAPDHGVHQVAVRHRVGEPLEHDDAGAAAGHRAGRLGVERPAVAVGGEDAALGVPVATAAGDDRRAAGQRDVALAGQQRLRGHVHGDQGGGAAGLHADAGAPQVDLVRHPGRQEVLVVADGGLERPDPGHQVRVGQQIVQQVGALPHPGVDTCHGCRGVERVTGVLQRLPGALQEDPVLRVEQLRLTGREPEEAGVEAGRVVEDAEGTDVVGVVELLGCDAVGDQVGVVEGGERFDPVAQVAPEGVEGGGPGNPERHSDDGDGGVGQRTFLGHHASPLS
ncbi:hypothetical protein ONO86_04252 [Micromonospora noduli]|nr:hypothetical protein ONO86_04252 [Micromonospora noduli]